MADVPLLSAVSGAALKKCFEFSAQSISNTAWAFAILALIDFEPLFKATSSAAVAKICELAP